MVKTIIKIKSVVHHRNGIGGRPFDLVEFSLQEDGMVRPLLQAVLPYGEREGKDGVECYVINPAEPDDCWRGDRLMAAIVEAVKESKL